MPQRGKQLEEITRSFMSQRKRTTTAETSSTSSNEEATSPPAAAAAAPAASATRSEGQHSDETLLALLQQRRQDERVVLATAALTGTLPASLASPYLAPLSVAPPTSLELYLAAAQREQQQRQLLSSGLSPSTYLELAQHRPDLLAALQRPTTQIPLPSLAPGAPTATRTMEAASALASLLPAKRPRDESKESVEEEAPDLKETAIHVKKEPPPVRPRKRVMFHLGDMGNVTADGDDGDDEDEEPWTTFMHRNFVEAVFAAGIRHASPSVLLDLMSNEEDFPLTSERVKSRLQKYRNNAEKSLSDFMQEYDTFLQRALSIGSQSPSSENSRLLPFAKVLQIMGQEGPLYGGDAAAAVSYELLYRRFHGKAADHPSTAGGFDSTVHRMLTPSALKASSALLTEKCQGQKLEIPQLTEDEKASALGASFEHVKSVFSSLMEELERQRSAKANSPAKDARGPTEEKMGDAKPKAVEGPRLGSKAVHSREGDENQDDESVASEEEKKKKDEIGAVVALMYQHEKGRKDS